MDLKILNHDFSVCSLEHIDTGDTGGEFWFLSKTDDEISLVCETQHIPSSAIKSEHGWRALKICGTLDFGMVGVIAGISGILAEHKIPLFVVSTYNTDYILIKKNLFDSAVNLLKQNGYNLT